MKKIKISIILAIWIILNPIMLAAQILLPTVLSSDLDLLSGEIYLIKDSLVVPDAYKLSIPADTKIKMSEAAVLIVDGSIKAQASATQPIIFEAETNSWKGIYLRGANDIAYFEHCIIRDAKTPSADFLAAFSAIDSDVYLYGIQFSNNGQCVYIENSGTTKIINCQFAADNLREHINIRQNSDCLVDSCFFYQVNGGDAIDFDQVSNGVISNCFLEAGVDDGIDIGEESEAILIQGNQIFNFFENGVTVGEDSKIQMDYNLIVNCAKAIEAKDGGNIEMNNNTLDQNDFGFAGFEFLGVSGGFIEVANTIVSNNQVGLIQGEDLDLTIRYSLSNSHFLPGSTNLFADPHYQQAANRNYQLKPISPCIDQGDPTSPFDPDNSRADIGAFPTDGQALPITTQNFPNPFQQQTIFSYELSAEQEVELLVYDIRGRQLFELINARQAAGKHNYHWLTASIAAGVYIYVLYVDGEPQYTGKAIKL